MSKLQHMQEVYVHFSHHIMSNWNKELSINIDVYVELGKSTDEIQAMFSEAYNTGNQMYESGIKGSKEMREWWNVQKKAVI